MILLSFPQKFPYVRVPVSLKLPSVVVVLQPSTFRYLFKV